MSQLTTLSPDNLPPRTTTVDVTAPRFELHREGDAYLVGHPGAWVMTDLAGIPETILALDALAVRAAGLELTL